jgi:lysophospholipase
VTDIVKPKAQADKLILYAHSMGGAIGALVLEHYPRLFQCAILSAPMLEVDIGRYSNRSAWLLFSLASMNRHIQKFAPGERGFVGEPQYDKSSAMSQARYMRVFEARQKDERLQTSGATYAWVAASLKAVRILQKNAYRVKTPVLLFQAEKDTMVKPKGQERFAQNTENTTLVQVKEAKHEIYNATDEIIEDYFKQIFAFIEAELFE